MEDTDWRPSHCPECGVMRAAQRFPKCHNPQCKTNAHTRADLSDAKDKRIAELEQLVATLEAERDELAERIGRSLDFINADMTDEAKQELRATLAELKGPTL